MDAKKAFMKARAMTQKRANFACAIEKSPYNNNEYIVKCIPAKLAITKRKIRSTRHSRGKETRYSTTY